MHVFRFVTALAAFAFLSGCTINSETILPDHKAAGEVIEGFSTEAAFNLEGIDHDTGEYKVFAKVTPEREGDAVRYLLETVEESDDDLVVQAKKISDSNYVIRYSDQTKNDGGIAFVTAKSGTYYLLSGLGKEGALEEIFKGQNVPSGGGDKTVMLDTMSQAEQISSWLDANYQRLADSGDVSVIRLAQ